MSGESKIVGNLKISFQNSSRHKEVIENQGQLRKVKDYLERNFPHDTTTFPQSKKLINDRDNLQNIFDEVRQVIENESDLEFIEIKSDSGESSTSLQSTVASYNINDLDRDDRNISQHSDHHDNITEINRKSTLVIDELKIEDLTHSDILSKDNSKNSDRYNKVQKYINESYDFKSNDEILKENILSPRQFEEKYPIKNLEKLKNEDEISKNRLFIKTKFFESQINSTPKINPSPISIERSNPKSSGNKPITEKSSYQSLSEAERMKKLREEYFSFKLANRNAENGLQKPKVTNVYAQAIYKNESAKDTAPYEKKVTLENKSDDILLPCKQNPSQLVHSSLESFDIKNSENEYEHHEYTIHNIRNKIKNNTSRVQKKILKLNLLNANANRTVEKDVKKNVRKYEKTKPSTNNDIIIKHTMIDNYFQHNYGNHNKEDGSYFSNHYKKGDYNQSTYFDDGYGSESNRTYSSSVSQSMDANGLTDFINSDMYSRAHDNRNSFYIDAYSDDLMSTSDIPPPLHKKYSKSQSELDNLMTRNSREAKYHDEELERENKKTIHGKLENLLKEKVKSMNDLNKAATLPPKKYKQNYAATRPLDKTKTLPSNYMQEHVYNQLYGNSGPGSNLALEIESDEEDYDPVPVRSSIPPGLTKPPAMYQTSNGDTKDAALRESMLSELKKTVKGRSMKQKEKAESLFSPTRAVKPTKRDESENRIQRRQQKMSSETYDTNTAMDVLNDFDRMNASFEKDNNERVTRENYQKTSQRSSETKLNHETRYSREKTISHNKANHHEKSDMLVERTSLPSAKFFRDSNSKEAITGNISARSNTSKPPTPRGDINDDIYLFDSFPLPKNFTLPNRSKPTSPSASNKSEKSESLLKQRPVSTEPKHSQIQRQNSMKLDTSENPNFQRNQRRNDENHFDLSPTDLEIKSILEQHNIRKNASREEKLNKTETERKLQSRTSSDNGSAKSPHKFPEPQQRLSLIEKRTSNLSASTMTLSNKKMSEKIIQASGLKTQEDKRRPKSAAEFRSDTSDSFTTYILRSTTPVEKPKKEAAKKRQTVYDELTSKIVQAKSYENQEISLDDLRREMSQKKGQSISLINLDEINKTPSREPVKELPKESPIRSSNVHEKFTRQTYTATNIGKVNIPKQFQNNDYRFSSPKAGRDREISRSTPASPTKRARSFSFNNRKSPVPRPKSTQSANASRPSTPKIITNKIRSLFSPRSKRKSRGDVSSDVLLTDSDEFIARRTNMNRSIGNDGFDIDDIADALNGDLSDDGDDIDVDFITNQDWINQEQQQMKNKSPITNGNTDPNNNLPNGHVTNGLINEQKEKRAKKTKQPYIKGSLIPAGKNGSIQLKSKHGIGRVVVPDVFSNAGHSPTNRPYKQTDNMSKRSSTLSDVSKDHSFQNGKIPSSEKSYVQSAAHVQQNGHVMNGHDNVNVKMTRNRRMQDVSIEYV